METRIMELLVWTIQWYCPIHPQLENSEPFKWSTEYHILFTFSHERWLSADQFVVVVFKLNPFRVLYIGEQSYGFQACPADATGSFYIWIKTWNDDTSDYYWLTIQT